MKHMTESFLADWTGLTVAQVRTLMVLESIQVMNYEIVVQLDLFPKSKMRERVLDALHAEGWIQFHRNETESRVSGGRPTLAWSLIEARKPVLLHLIRAAEEAAKERLFQAQMKGQALASEILGLPEASSETKSDINP